ncbi:MULTISPECIES: hypothetical protein [Stenotrophomonas]|uniref:Uncharacterized protein n=1 Tax=Stenotrophomonas maltophilia TaxID=40324 RepID=A0A2W6I648_STEMA|nr:MULTISPECIES: hypothetical protein [Stenotrophomonas]PSM13854.1 hypothetical protein CV100_09870 [Stenotrophomonas maltophilia]PZS91220.1 hypothetical protein A7X83_09465 [Stenotrophomonas maltophilia]
MTSTVEFFIEAIARDHAGRPVHVGFVVTGGSLSVGDVFISLYEVPRTLEDAQQGRARAAPVNVRATSIRVEAIDVRRKQVPSLTEGTIGALYLTGQDVDAIGVRTYLSTSN